MNRRRLHRSNSARGVAVVEFAIIISLLLLLLLGAADFGRIFYAKIVLEGAAAAGAHYGTRIPGAYSNAAGIQAAALADSGGLTGISVTQTLSCSCKTGAPDCTFCDDAGETNPAPYLLLNVQTAYTFVPIVANFPGIPSSVTVAGKAVMRAQ